MSIADRIIHAFNHRGVPYEIIGPKVWKARVRPGIFDPHGALLHHNAGKDSKGSLDILVNGRGEPDPLLGPLCNFSPNKKGVVRIISPGKCNHAGQISAKVYDDMMHGHAPKGNAADFGYPDDGPTGNGLLFGFEIINMGDGKDPYPKAQVDATVLACAALAEEWGWGPARFAAHREVTRRKPDPRGLNMGDMRSRIAATLDDWR